MGGDAATGVVTPARRDPVVGRHEPLCARVRERRRQGHRARREAHELDRHAGPTPKDGDRKAILAVLWSHRCAGRCPKNDRDEWTIVSSSRPSATCPRTASYRTIHASSRRTSPSAAVKSRDAFDTRKHRELDSPSQSADPLIMKTSFALFIAIIAVLMFGCSSKERDSTAGQAMAPTASASEPILSVTHLGDSDARSVQESEVVDSDAAPSHQSEVGELVANTAEVVEISGEATATASSVLPPDPNVTFEPANLLDGRLETSWQPFAKSTRGVGEWFTLTFSGPQEVLRLEIANGFQTTYRGQDLFVMNARLDEVEIDLGARKLRHSFASDVRGFEQIPIVPPVKTDRITVRVISVHRGTRWPDVVVSEVRVFALGAQERTSNLAEPTTGSSDAGPRTVLDPLRHNTVVGGPAPADGDSPCDEAIEKCRRLMEMSATTANERIELIRGDAMCRSVVKAVKAYARASRQAQEVRRYGMAPTLDVEGPASMVRDMTCSDAIGKLEQLHILKRWSISP